MNRNILVKAAAFAIALVVVDRGLSYVLDAGFRRTETGANGGMVNRALAVRADAVILGSSRAWRHYDSSVFAERLGMSVYNAGCDGQGLPYMRGLADLILHDYTPKLLIVNVDATSLQLSPRPWSRVVTLAPFMDHSPVIRDLIYSRGSYERIKYLSRSYRYNDKVLAILSNLGERDQTAAGFVPVEGRLDLRLASSASRSEMLAPPESVREVDPRCEQLLIDIIKAAREKDVQVVIVSSPRWRADGQVAPDLAPLFDRAKGIAQKMNVDYININLENAPVFRDAALFADVSHLNARGASMLSEQIADALLAMGYGN